MAELLANDPISLRQLIFYEFHGKTPIFNAYKNFCDRLGANVMIYPEFEFWWMRFAQGKFDLVYDRGQDPIYRTITDMPMDIHNKIVESLDPSLRFTLRHVSKSFRDQIDSLKLDIPFIKIWNQPNRIEVSFGDRNLIYEKLEEEEFTVSYRPNLPERQDYRRKGKMQEVVVDDVVSILKHPDFKLEKFEFRGNDNDFSKKLSEKVQLLQHKIHVTKAKIQFDNETVGSAEGHHCIWILKNFQPGILQEIEIGIDFGKTTEISQDQFEKLYDELNGLEQCQQAQMVVFAQRLLAIQKIKLPRFTLLSTSGISEILKILPQSSTLQKLVLNSYRMTMRNMVAWLRDHLEGCTEQMKPRNRYNNPPMVFNYRQPVSNALFSVKVYNRSVEIERKSQ